MEKERKENVTENIKTKNNNLGSLKNKVSFSGGCVSFLNFKAFFKPCFTVYNLVLIFLLIYTSNIKKGDKEALLKI